MTFVQAKHYTRTNGRQIDLVVIHDMEAAEGTKTAESVANYFARGDSRASAHYCCDVDSTVQCVYDKDVAWHAPGANHNGIGLELAGYARQTAEEWKDAYSTKMLTEQVAPLARSLCLKYNVPMKYVDREGLKRGERGITTHNEVSKAFGKSSHWDPGPNFPMSWFIEVVIGKSHGGADRPPTKPTVAQGDKVLNEGDKGEEVKIWQRMLVGAGFNVPVDGDFGAKTKAATIEFQKKLGVPADGQVGPKTNEAVAKLLAYIAAVEAAKKKAPAPAPAKRATLKKGAQGADVKYLQERLNKFGFALKVDSDFGVNTEVAVKRFQKGKGLRADGIVGSNTWAKLG